MGIWALQRPGLVASHDHSPLSRLFLMWVGEMDFVGVEDSID